MKAMLFAAGLGTRMKPWTDHHPKALALVNGKTLLQRNIEYLQGFNIREVIVNVHHFADQIETVINSNMGWGSHVIVSDERDEVLETGGGLMKVRKFLETEDIFLTMNADILTNLHLNKMVAAHKQQNNLITLAVMERESSRQLLFDGNQRLSGWKNRLTGEVKGIGLGALIKEESLRELAFSGIALYAGEVFTHINKVGKFSLTDVFLELADKHQVCAFEHTGDILLDVGSEEKRKIAEKIYSHN